MTEVQSQDTCIDTGILDGQHIDNAKVLLILCPPTI
jgi:hypothetical protein